MWNEKPNFALQVGLTKQSHLDWFCHPATQMSNSHVVYLRRTNFPHSVRALRY